VRIAALSLFTVGAIAGALPSLVINSLPANRLRASALRSAA
jgi:hypothetical protein